MYLTIKAGLLPNPSQAVALGATMNRFNAAANWLAGVALESGCSDKYRLQKRHYAELRARFCLSAQATVRCIARVSGVIRHNRSVRPHFRRDASVPYDARLLSRKAGGVSIWTLCGREIVGLAYGRHQAAKLRSKWRECDLIRRRDGRWFLNIRVEVPEAKCVVPHGFFGVDLGLVNVAADSDGTLYSGDLVERVRRKYAEKRRRLQIKASQHKKGGKRPKAVRRKLRELAHKEAAFRKDVNHRLSKVLVQRAKDTGRGHCAGVANAYPQSETVSRTSTGAHI